MTRDDARKILGDGATEEQVTSLLNSIHNEVAEKDKQIKTLSETILNDKGEIDRLKASDDELQKIKQAQMTEQEKLVAQQKDLEKQMQNYKKLANSVKAKSVLVGAGISEENANNLVSKFVKEDEQATLDLANAFVSEFNSIKELTEKKVKDDLASIDVTPKGGNVNPKAEDNTMTWEKFQNLSPEEQSKFQSEHPDEFESL